MLYKIFNEYYNTILRGRLYADPFVVRFVGVVLTSVSEGRGEECITENTYIYIHRNTHY